MCPVETSRFTTFQLAGWRLRIHYHDVGNRSALAPVVVLLHGVEPGTSGWESFRGSIQALVGAGYRALLIDLPGWGKSDSIICTEPRPRLNARCVLRLLDVLRISNPVHVVGSSMGADSALALGAEAPHRLRKLILVGGGAGIGGKLTAQSEGIHRMLRFYRSPSAGNLRDLLEFTAAATTEVSDTFIQSRLNAIRARSDHLESFTASIKAYPDQFPELTYCLQKLWAPTMLVWGRQDQVLPLQVGQMLLSELRNAQMHVLEDCGHTPHQEHPAAFNELLLTFLAAGEQDNVLAA